MSMMSPVGAKHPEIGEVVASYTDYEAANKAVSSLIAADVKASDIAIVGLGLRSIERVTGRLGYATAARSGAVNGLLLGLLMAAVFVLTSPEVPIQLFIGVLFVGIALGMLLSLISYTIVRRRRDFASVMQVVADHYDVTVLPSSIHRAREVLGTAVTRKAPVAGVPVDAEPPRYGERIVPAAAPVSEQPTETDEPAASGDVDEAGRRDGDDEAPAASQA